MYFLAHCIIHDVLLPGIDGATWPENKPKPAKTYDYVWRENIFVLFFTTFQRTIVSERASCDSCAIYWFMALTIHIVCACVCVSTVWRRYGARCINTIGFIICSAYTRTFRLIIVIIVSIVLIDMHAVPLSCEPKPTVHACTQLTRCGQIIIQFDEINMYNLIWPQSLIWACVADNTEMTPNSLTHSTHGHKPWVWSPLHSARLARTECVVDKQVFMAKQSGVLIPK